MQSLANVSAFEPQGRMGNLGLEDANAGEDGAAQHQEKI